MNRPAWEKGIPPFLDAKIQKPLVLSYTLLNTYKNICPHQAYRRYIRKDVPFVKTPAMEFGDKVHMALEHRINSAKPLPADMRQWEPIAAALANAGAKAENKFGITKEGQPCAFFDDKVWLRGKLDAYMVNDTTAFLFDHKTGTPREDPFELEIQALLLNALFPQLTNIFGCFGWLKENRVGQKHDLSHTRDIFTYIHKIAADLQENMIDGEFAKVQSGLCGWCDVMDCEHRRERPR